MDERYFIYRILIVVVTVLIIWIFTRSQNDIKLTDVGPLNNKLLYPVVFEGRINGLIKRNSTINLHVKILKKCDAFLNAKSHNFNGNPIYTSMFDFY